MIQKIKNFITEDKYYRLRMIIPICYYLLFFPIFFFTFEIFTWFKCELVVGNSTTTFNNNTHFIKFFKINNFYLWMIWWTVFTLLIIIF